MRNSKKFYELLLQYEAASIRRRTPIFWEMEKEAKTFSDWTSVYQYAGDSIRKDAQRQMEKLVLRGNKASNIQLNILELFLIIDQGDKDEILRKYLRKYHKKDDLLFALENTDWDYSDLKGDVMKELEKFYVKPGNINRGLEARHKRSLKLLEKSTFNP